MVDKMIYYYLEDNSIKQFRVIVNKTRLREIKKEVISRCSEVKHIVSQTTKLPDENKFINNLKYNIIGKKYNDFIGRDIPLYNVEYDYYVYPKLISIIDDLLHDNVDSLDDFYIIINSIKEENLYLEQLYNEFEVANDSNDSKLAGNIKGKIIAFERYRELNPIKDYYMEVYNSINLKKLRSLSVNTLIKVDDFFEATQSPISTANKILSRRKTILKKNKDMDIDR